MTKKTDLHAIILADGHDHSLKSLVEALEEVDIPKPLACIAGRGSLLQQTVQRYARLVAPKRMIVVVPAAFEALAHYQLGAWRGISIMARPGDKERRPDVLLPLAYLLARTPGAHVLVTPAHHYAPAADTLPAAVASAACALDRHPLVLLGVPAGQHRTTRGWIIPGRPLENGLAAVAGLVEDESTARAAELAMQGGLWNIETCVGKAEYLWHRISRMAPMQAEAVAGFWASLHPSVDHLSSALLDFPPVGLNSALLRSAKDIATLAVHGSGWSDWTSTEHVLDSIANPREVEQLLSRIWDRQIAHGRTELRPPIPARHASAA